MRRQTMLLWVMLFGGLLSLPASAQVNVNVNIGPPAPVIVQAPPTMVFLAEPGVYMAMGVPYDIFFISGRYYYSHGGNWFWGPGYGGPWAFVEYRTLPPGLRKFKIKRLREYGDQEYRVYKVQGSNFKGKHFAAIAAPAGQMQERDKGEHGKKGKKH